MPTVNGIQLELQCQQNISGGGSIEEFAPRPLTDTDPTSLFMPELYSHNTRTCSVFIPIFPHAQFFLKYELAPLKQYGEIEALHLAHRPALTVREHEFYVLQLLIGGDEITTWSCGAEQEWHGKTCFALFDQSGIENNPVGGILEKRVFAFNGDIRVVGDLSRDEDRNRKIEVRVFRANKSMRRPAMPMRYEGQGVTADTRTPSGGVLESSRSKRYHMFGLVDHIDKPFAVFRWFYRSWDEIHALGLGLGSVDETDGIVFANLDMSKHPLKKTVQVGFPRTIGTGLSQAANSRSFAAAPLRYDRKQGGFVPLQETSRAFKSVRPVANIAEPSRSKHGSVHIPTSMLLPPQHPHAQPLPKITNVQKHPQARQSLKFGGRAGENTGPMA